MPELLVITGPTATGKTALGAKLARLLDGEVVGADSMQIYRGMDIGTAKPTAAEMGGVPHHMIDVADPSESFSAARWAAMASVCVDDILARGRVPVVVGGTGLYIDALLRRADFAAAPGDSGLREQLEAEYDALGGEAFRRRLAEVDPARAEKLAPGDKKRLVRALEVFRLTGETITAHDERSRREPPRYTSMKVALDFTERERLYERIDRRAAQMFADGLADEVRGLLAAGLSERCTAMQAIGYKETAAYLRGETSLDEAIERVQRESRRYAKRQLTWLRREEGVRWLRWENAPDICAARQIATEFSAR